VTYCQGDVAVPLSAQVLAGHTSKWYPAATGGIGVPTAPTPNTAAPGTYTLYVSQVNTLTGCEGPRAAAVITVHPKPRAQWSAQLTDGDSCSIPQTYLFTNTSTAHISRTWRLYSNGSLIQADTSLHFSRRFSTSGRFELELIVTNGNGCSDTTSTELKINAGIQSSMSAQPLEGCEPLSVRIDLIQTFNSDLDSLYTVMFYPGDGTSTALPLTLSHQFAYDYHRFGSYTPYVVTTMFSGCSDTAFVPTITVYLTPDAAFTYSLVNYRTLSFQNQSTDVDTSSQFYWSFGDGATSNEIAPIHTYHPDVLGKDSIEICLIVTNYFGCADTLCTQNWIWPAQLGIPNAFAPELIYVEDDHLFAPKGHSLQSYELKIYDSWGNLVYQTTALDSKGIPSEPWNGRLFNSGEQLPMGVYVWTVEAYYNDGTRWPGQEDKFGQTRRYGTVTLLR
jgi:hypothetical protein